MNNIDEIDNNNKVISEFNSSKIRVEKRQETLENI